MHVFGVFWDVSGDVSLKFRSIIVFLQGCGRNVYGALRNPLKQNSESSKCIYSYFAKNC